jgi:uncharacterized protein DUF1496
MRRCWIWILAGASCFATATATAAPEPKPNASPACLYESKAYSEGAFVCVQKSVMLACTVEGGHMSWKLVPDREIRDRCTAPSVPHASAEPRVRARRHHFVVRRIHPRVANPAKCFAFNGREYCE